MKRILFVDDESRILDGLGRALRTDRGRWDVQFAVGGEAALKAFEASTFDIVISDMRMPGMDGATLLGQIRDRFPDTARIVLSGHSDMAMASRAVSVAHRFLAKPCSPVELHCTIERLCTLQDVLSSPEIRAIVGRLGELPSLSTTYVALTDLLANPNVQVAQVSGIIEKDVAMSAKVLQLVNSAFFGMTQKVTSLQSAVTYLGLETIKNLALASEAFRVFVPSSRIPQSICEGMQQHAHRAAAIAAVLPGDRKMRESTVVAALLHDIGSLILASTMPEEFCLTRDFATENKCHIFEAEEILLGVSHAEIGAYLLGLWGIPNLAVEAVAHHHRPTRIPHSGFDSSVAVYVADILAHELEESPPCSRELEIEDRAYMETLEVLPRLAEFRQLALQTAAVSKS